MQRAAFWAVQIGLTNRTNLRTALTVQLARQQVQRAVLFCLLRTFLALGRKWHGAMVPLARACERCHRASNRQPDSTRAGTKTRTIHCQFPLSFLVSFRHDRRSIRQEYCSHVSDASLAAWGAPGKLQRPLKTHAGIPPEMYHGRVLGHPRASVIPRNATRCTIPTEHERVGIQSRQGQHSA